MNGLSSGIVSVLIAIVYSHPAQAQSFANANDLPDAPASALQAAPSVRPASEAQGTAVVNGIVQDSQEDPVPGAKVILIAPGKLGESTAVTGMDGTFAFTAIPA